MSATWTSYYLITFYYLTNMSYITVYYNYMTHIVYLVEDSSSPTDINTASVLIPKTGGHILIVITPETYDMFQCDGDTFTKRMAEFKATQTEPMVETTLGNYRLCKQVYCEHDVGNEYILLSLTEL